MDLSTTYLGLKLKNPLMPGASPLVADLDAVRKLEDAGAAAIVMNSLFEEQIVAEQLATHHAVDVSANSFAEALSYFPAQKEYRLGPEEYLEQIGRIKKAVKIPVITSLNGTTRGGWLDYARLMEEAGADAIELNVYSLATDEKQSGDKVEQETIDLLKELKKTARVPIAVKLSPYYSSLAHFAMKLDGVGADGLVLFNRFYQPDIDVEKLEVERTLHLSDSRELNLRLRWLAILSGKIRPSLAVSGGVHTGLDAVKAVMTGAHAVQMVSALLLKGPDRLGTILEEMTAWLEDHDYESLVQMQGSMNLKRCPDPKSYERANYMHILQGWRG
jgi:dihydroorotate dehydrogenase (fumarate)